MEHSKAKIDWGGTIFLTAAIISLMFALELGGKEYAWDSLQIIGLFAGFVVLLAGLFSLKNMQQSRLSRLICSKIGYLPRAWVSALLMGRFYFSRYVHSFIHPRCIRRLSDIGRLYLNPNDAWCRGQ